MKAIVFGGSGFIGSHVADRLTEGGYDVTIFDLKPSPYLLPAQKIIRGNILDKEAVFDAVKGHDYIYNFAGLADLDTSATEPLKTIEQNIMGTAILLEGALRNEAKRFIQASTIYVYSETGGFYRCSKQAAELYVEEYNRRFGLEFTILRYGTVYGPRADSRNSIYRYLKQALTEGKIDCGGSGDETREYIHVRDAAQLSVDILADKYRNKQVIITGHHPMRLKDMLYTIREILSNQIEINFEASKSDTPHYNITPYSFVPRIGRKLVTHEYVDMGQGLLECISEIYGQDMNREQ
ncbi:MAG: NAD(P)-dependent oxidoreductase [Dehalococcoidia bacterium]|nr:NAD(P)-dependent oxidoreductase [Dehalococcoidia bacterium]